MHSGPRMRSSSGRAFILDAVKGRGAAAPRGAPHRVLAFTSGFHVRRISAFRPMSVRLFPGGNVAGADRTATSAPGWGRPRPERLGPFAARGRRVRARRQEGTD
jgi:hypothetical protein